MVLLTFLWVAYRTVETTLVRAGGERAQGAADQVANLLDVRQSMEQLNRLARDPEIRRYLQTPTDEARETIRKRLMSLASGGLRRVELWDDAGSRVFEFLVPSSAAGGTPSKALPAANPPTRVGLSALQTADDVVFSDAVAEIPRQDPPTGELPTGGRLGYLVIRSSFSVSPPGIISRLVGYDALVAVGNRTGGVWTDFSHLVPAPGVDLTQAGVREYRMANGEWHVGAVATIPATPWAVWVEFPRARLVAPAWVFLQQILVIALLFVAGGAVLARTLAARITKPLSELTSAAETIAAGDYSRRVSTDRRDELGRLGHAFNTMAGHIEESQRRLETRVTERTTELAAARREADRANRAKSEFLSLMSHDLRTPLNAILGFAQLLEIDDLNPDQIDHVRQILSGGRHLLDLISEVLDITRIESGQLSLSPEPVSVRDVVQRAVDLVRPLATQRDITLRIESFSANSVVQADRQRLSQILLNLLSNAVKYNRLGGHVTIGGGPVPPDRYRITVTDTGAGIPESKIALLFHPFERLGAEQTSVEGTGLGLALSRALAEAMGGTLGVKSVIDQGSTFWVELPAVDGHAPRTAASSHEGTAPTAHVQGGLVLYVEDNLSNVHLMERILRQRPGVELLHAPNGHAALALVLQRRPDLILLDMHLPDMSGEEVLHQLWADPASRRVPIIVVTADATPGLARRLKASGATACVTKPLNIKEVLGLMDQLLIDDRDVRGDV